LTGGSIHKKSSGIFSRKKDLEDLQAANSELKEKRLEELAEKQGLEKIYQEKLKAEREASYVIQDLQMEKTKLQERREGFVKDLNRLAGILKEAERSLASQREELVLLDGELERIEGKIKEHQTQRMKSKDYLKELKEKRTKEYNEYDLLKQEVMEASVQEATLIEAYKGKREAIDKLKVSLETLESSKSELEKENGGLLIEIKEGQNAVALLEKAVEALKSELQHMEKILDEMAMEEIRDKAEMKDLSATVRTLDEEYHVIDKELFKVKDALEKLEKENQSLLNKINDELNLTLAEAKEERIPMEDKDLFRKKLNTLRREISSLGHVNVAAIEEFREVSEHSTFLSSQKEDLEKAKLELKEIIMDMTLRMRTLFTENFKVMNENFNDTFRRLFQGGNAKLILGDGDILEAPIEISVQPPGKKLQNITLMSGGEKVLSAIALTFAILRMKPTPFCILDEIEAALDDANVYRFAEFLSEFARETQFILITHRKGTMESADALYGVTMEEKGISKIVSMDLSAARRENG
jgi:chromosome segregation protein